MCEESSHAIVNIKPTFTETRLLIWKRELLNVLDYIYRELGTLSFTPLQTSGLLSMLRSDWLSYNYRKRNSAAIVFSFPSKRFSLLVGYHNIYRKIPKISPEAYIFQ